MSETHSLVFTVSLESESARKMLAAAEAAITALHAFTAAVLEMRPELTHDGRPTA